jgi:hypothetical protein
MGQGACRADGAEADTAGRADAAEACQVDGAEACWADGAEAAEACRADGAEAAGVGVVVLVVVMGCFLLVSTTGPFDGVGLSRSRLQRTPALAWLRA